MPAGSVEWNITSSALVSLSRYQDQRVAGRAVLRLNAREPGRGLTGGWCARNSGGLAARPYFATGYFCATHSLYPPSRPLTFVYPARPRAMTTYDDSWPMTQ